MSEALDLPARKEVIPGIAAWDEFRHRGGEPAIPPVRQWNYDPGNSPWPVTQRRGRLRVHKGRSIRK